VEAHEGYKYLNCVIFNQETYEQETTTSPTVTLTMNYNYTLTFTGKKVAEKVAVLSGKTLWWRIPIPKVAVDVDGYKAETDLQGKFEVTVPVGTYTIKASNPLFDPYEAEIDLPEQKAYETEIGLTMKLMVKAVAIAVPSALTGIGLALRRK